MRHRLQRHRWAAAEDAPPQSRRAGEGVRPRRDLRVPDRGVPPRRDFAAKKNGPPRRRPGKHPPPRRFAQHLARASVRGRASRVLRARIAGALRCPHDGCSVQGWNGHPPSRSNTVGVQGGVPPIKTRGSRNRGRACCRVTPRYLGVNDRKALHCTHLTGSLGGPPSPQRRGLRPAANTEGRSPRQMQGMHRDAMQLGHRSVSVLCVPYSPSQ